MFWWNAPKKRKLKSRNIDGVGTTSRPVRRDLGREAVESMRKELEQICIEKGTASGKEEEVAKDLKRALAASEAAVKEAENEKNR